MNGKNGEPNNRELYALLHVSPEASDEEIRTAYRQWAQVYHPDKYQSPQMKEVATVNFQRVREAYEILTDENKRMIYDIYGMDGLTSGLELGHKLNKVDEIKEELERLQRQREQEKVAAHVRSFGSILANLSWPDFLDGDSIMIGMGMASEVQSQISKRTSLAVGGNLAVNTNSGGGAATAILRHHISPVASVEFMGSIGLQSLIGIQTTRELSVHSAAVMGITMSLRDGSINLSNTWSRQLSEKTNGNIQLSLGPESYIGVGWRKKEQKMSASEEIKILLSNNLNPVFATGAFIIPLSLYFTLKNFVFKPYYHRRERQKALENIAKTQSQKRENRNGVIDAVSKRVAMEAALSSSCVFCQIACSSTSTTLLHKDDKIVAFQDINPSAFRHYLVIPIEHIPTVNDLQRRSEDFSLVSNMLNVGQTLLQRDAPHAKHYRFGFHQPPFNSVNHLHLHCFALPFITRWKAIKYLSLGPFGGFIEAEKLLERIKSLSSL